MAKLNVSNRATAVVDLGRPVKYQSSGFYKLVHAGAKLRKLFNWLVVLAVGFCLTACRLELVPPTSGSVEVKNSSFGVQQTVLSGNQLSAVSKWFSQRATGWSSSSASYVPNLVIRVNHSDGDTSVINVLAPLVVVYNKHGQYVQQFSSEAIDALRVAVNTH